MRWLVPGTERRPPGATDKSLSRREMEPSRRSLAPSIAPPRDPRRQRQLGQNRPQPVSGRSRLLVDRLRSDVLSGRGGGF